MIKKVLFLAVLSILLPSTVWGADGNKFTAKVDASGNVLDNSSSGGILMTFRVISESEKTCQVGEAFAKEDYTDDMCAVAKTTNSAIIIPSQVKSYSVVKIGYGAFRGSRITGVTIPSSVRTIGNAAFSSCYYLVTVNISEGLKEIEADAFSYCHKISTLPLPESVESIGSYAFSSCTGITDTSLKISKNVKEISSGSDNNPFDGLSHLTSITVAPDNAYFDSRDNCNAIIRKSNNTLITGCINTTIPSSVTSIGYTAFSYCPFTTFTVPEQIQSIASFAFSNCEQLVSISLPSRLNSISGGLFYRCTSLANVQIPERVTSIGLSAFNGCSSLTSITIPSKVQSIGSNAFYGCTSLTSVTSYIEEPPTLQNGTFPSNSNSELNVPFGKKETYQNMAEWNKFSTITEMAADETPDFFVVDTQEGIAVTYSILDKVSKTCCVGYTDDTSDKAAVTNGSSLTGTLTIPSTVTLPGTTDVYTVKEIGPYAFYYCNKLTSIVIPDGVEDIDTRAFYRCSKLESITLPQQLRAIGDEAFMDCESIESINIPEKVITIGKGISAGCAKLSSITVSGGNIFFSSPNNCNAIISGQKLIAGCKNTTIPTTITTIATFALKRLTDATIVIPDNITKIESFAFQDTERSIITLPATPVTIKDYGFTYVHNSTFISSYQVPIAIPGNTFYNIDTYKLTMVLKVPLGTKAAYLAATGWNAFEADNIIENTSKTIDVATAGTLSQFISDAEKFIITDLTITGNLNGTDFRLIREMAGNDYLGRPTNGVLSKLDISGANIVEGGEKYLDIEQATSLISKYIQDIGDISCQFVTQNNVIGTAVFAGCDKLEDIALPHSITSIEGYVFLYCQNLKSLEIPKNVSSIGSGFVFGPNRISKISVAEGNQTFSSPEGSNVLMQGTKLIFGLSSAKIPAETTIIGSNAFVSCSGLGDVTLPERVTRVELRAFAWSSLTSIKMPSALKTIGNDAFAYCQNLTSVSIENKTPLVITKNTFTNRAEATLYVPAGCKAAYEAADYWKEFKTIVEKEAPKVKLNKTKATIEKGKTLTLKATVTPSTLEDKSVTWKSSDTKIATVSSSGKVKGVKTGTATITCTSNATGLAATCEVIVGTIKIDQAEIVIEKGNTLTLKSTVYPTTLEDKSVTWTSSDTKIATVSSSGKVKGVKTGTATITCTSNATGLAATCEVIVGTIKIDQTEIVLEKGKTMTLTSTVYPLTLEDKSVTWKSSDTKIATISSDGEVKGVKTGTATITCTSNATGLAATCEVTVGTVKIDKTEIVLEKGKTLTLKSTVYPTTLEDKSVTWTSSDTKIATVSSSGKVKGVKTGTATITCTSNATGLSATCEVIVGTIKVDKTDIVVEKGKTLTLKSTVYPTTLEDKSVTWKSSDKSVATVSSSGKVKGIAPGTATITCTSNATGLSATCTVTVVAAAGTRTYEGGIDEMDKTSEAEEPFDVYDMSGRKVCHQVTSLDGLPKGIYIVNGKKVLKK